MITRIDQVSDGPADKQGQTRSRNQSNGSWGSWVNGNGPYNQSWSTEFAQGEDIPNYHARKRRGELLPLTAYQWFSLVAEASFHSGHYTDTSANYSPTLEFNTWNVRRVYLPDIDELISKAKENTEAAEALMQTAAGRIASSGWDGLTFALEVRKLKSMLTRFTSRVVRLALSGRFDKIWLEARYGWRTLWFDMQDINNVLQNLDGERKRFRETAGTESLESETVTQTSSWANAYVHADYTLDWVINLRGTVAANIEPPRVQFNPVVTAWELLTLSFVIDWIINVGRFLDAMSFLSLATKHFASAGYFISLNTNLDRIYTTPKGSRDVVFTGSSGLGSATAVLKMRTPGSIPLTPLFDPNLDWLKVTDLLAIILGRLKR